MGFIKHALAGIAIYEIIKYCYNKTVIVPNETHQITLGGKQFNKTGCNLTADAHHRHHLDRPEVTSE